RKTKEFGIFLSTARQDVSVRVYKFERFDVVNERLHPQAAAMSIGRERAADGQAVCSSLFLRDAPRLLIVFLNLEVSRNEVWPEGACFNFERASLAVKSQQLR